MYQDFVNKLNDRYPDQGNCALIALAIVSGRHYLYCKQTAIKHGWDENGITFQGLFVTLRDLGISHEIQDGNKKRLKTWGRSSGRWIAKTKDHFAVIIDGQLINPAGCENDEVKMLLRIR